MRKTLPHTSAALVALLMAGVASASPPKGPPGPLPQPTDAPEPPPVEDTPPQGAPPSDAPPEAPPETPEAPPETPEAPPEAPEAPPSDQPPLPEETPPPTDQPPEPTDVRSGVRGVVLDGDIGTGIPDVVIETVDGSARTVTDGKGRFELRLPPGTYTLRIAADFYARRRVGGVIVRAGSFAKLDAKLWAEESEVVVVVAAPDTASDAVQVVRRRKRATVSDAVSAEQISRSPDSSASDAAKRMVGATIQDGKYVVVRGLGGRYSLTLLNGVPLPSPDPDVPSAPLDIFPAALLANLTVVKTFAPDTPANFAGGALSIETRSFPTRFTLRAKSGLAANSAASFRDLNSYPGGTTDWLGYDDGTRALPNEIPRDQLAGDPNLPVEAQNAQVSAFRDDWEITPLAAGPNSNLTVTVGDTVRVKNQQFGYFGSGSYGHSYSHRVTHITKPGEPDGLGGTLPALLQLDDDTGVSSANLSGLITAGWLPSPKHNYNLIGLYTHTGDISASRVIGTDDNEATIERTRLRFLEREMWFLQAVGEDSLMGGRLIAGWQGNLAHVEQHEPDTRDLVRTHTPDDRWAINTGSGSSERLFTDLGDDSRGGGLDLTLPFDAFKIKVGGSIQSSDRFYYARRFHFLLDSSAQFDDPNMAYASENAGKSMFLYEATLPSDGYEATRAITAAYAMADVVHFEPLRVVAGARFERSTLDVGLASPIDLMIEIDPPSHRVDTDILPSINAVYGLTGSTNLRFAYGETVARPNFREAAPALFYDYIRRRAIGGNPDLLETHVHNVDLRWETFIGDTELLAASLFYKKFKDPIEQTVENAGSGSNVGFQNADGATSYGVELEARFRLARLSRALREITVGANFALIGSSIDLSGAERPLQGQSPYVANMDIGYDHPATGTQISVMFNSFGRRIEEVGTAGAGNVYEEPFHRLDVTFSQRLPRDLKLKIGGSNLLDSRVVRRQDGVEILGYDAGISVGASVEFSID